MPSLFTRIIQREIPGDIVYEDEHCVAFRDIEPKAPVHILIVPREEVASVRELNETGDHTHLLNAAQKIAAQEGLESFRLVINTGADAGQTVFHLHVHLLGGTPLGDFA